MFKPKQMRFSRKCQLKQIILVRTFVFLVLLNFSYLLSTLFLVPQRVRAVLTWNEPDKVQWASGFRVILTHLKAVKHVAWHSKGDYFSSVMPEGDNRSVLIHQLSRRRSQLPFSKSKGLVQCTLFHPLRPYLFVAVIFNLNSTLSRGIIQIIFCRPNVTFEFTIF